MSESKEETARRRRLRWITLGEAIAIAALTISGLGLWNEFRKEDKPQPGTTTVIEKRAAIPLTLRGKPVDDGRALEISPLESSHALQSLTASIAGSDPIEIGADGRLDADDVERALPEVDETPEGTQSVRVRIDAQYVETGADKRSRGNYRLTYRWEGGGLFGGRSIRLEGLSRS